MAEDRAALEDLKAKGMQFDAISPETAAELRKATAGIVDEVKKRAGAELVKRVVSRPTRNERVETAPQGDVLTGFRRGLDALDWAIAKVRHRSWPHHGDRRRGSGLHALQPDLSLKLGEEISRLFFVWSIFFAIPLGVKAPMSASRF